MTTTSRSQLLEWMQRVLKSRDWTASTWCKQAGISPTVITRFMSNDDAPVPSTVSIYKLSQVAGVGPDFVSKNTVPLLKTCSDVNEWLEKRSAPEDTVWLPVGDALDLGSFALKAKSLNVLNRGIAIGSTIIVDPERQPKLGDIVIATSRVRDNQGLELFVFKPPYLEPDTPASPPVTWALKESQIIGVVTRLIVELVQEREQASEPTPAQ